MQHPQFSLQNVLPLDPDAPTHQGRRGSIVAEQYARGERILKDGVQYSGKTPSNEDIAKAVQQKVAAAVEMSRKYRHVAWYSLFVAAYICVLYLQASAYKSGDVVKTLKKAFLPDDGSTTMTFADEDAVLNYIGSKVILPIWKDPVCGDGSCEYPWEFPAWGRFGCKADCGMNPNVTAIVINVRADFTGHPSISPQVLMNNAAWNLCLEDEARRQRGEADLCWFESDQAFDSVQTNSINAASVIDGKWYVVVKGDYAGRVSGFVYDITNNTKPEPIATSPAWTSCQLRRPRVSSTQVAVRKLLQAYTQAHQVGGEEGQALLSAAIKDIQAMPELSHVNFHNPPDLEAAAKATGVTPGSAAT
ncbi:hypothetical protein V8C86DRAFT_2809369 [Haematococcus lacustris]